MPHAKAQELYPYSEPASNMPARSVSLKWGTMLERGVHSSRILQRHTPEVMLGLSKNWMVHLAVPFSDMHEEKFIWEGARVYAKYRFLSMDGVHRHFRMAAFGQAAYSRNHLDHNELTLLGDHSGVQYGLIATQLWNKLAVSATGSMLEMISTQRKSKETLPYAFQSVNYSLSAGYLVFPRNYSSYEQTNFNLYLEALGARNLDVSKDKYFIDLAPSVQFIFHSTAKLNIGYRFQVAGDIYRLADKSFMVGYEHIFLNALQRKRKPVRASP